MTLPGMETKTLIVIIPDVLLIPTNPMIRLTSTVPQGIMFAVTNVP